MTEPTIRFAVTEDGIDLAYWTMGSGPPLLLAPPGPVGHIAGELRVRDICDWYERLARSFTVIRFDPRGGGSSTGLGVDETHETRVIDMHTAALVEPPTPLALFASISWVPSAIEVAARWPEAISHLVLWDGFARAEEAPPSGRLLATRALIDKDWRAYTDAWIQAAFGWKRPERAREWSRWMREASTPEATLARISRWNQQDVSALLDQVRAPTLVIGHRTGGFNDPDASKRLAARIPNARLIVLDGPQSPPSFQPERSDEHAALIEEFIGVTPTPDTAARERSTGASGTAIILFADIVDSTALTERMGDAAFRERARTLDTSLREIITSAGGTAIDGKLLGDGVLATFPAAAQAIGAALRCGAAGNDGGLPLHLGLHAGDVIREQNNVFGGAVNIASRISGLSAPGEVLVSDVVRALARTSASVTFEDRGEHALKGVGEPQRVYAVRAAEAS
jgi:class 3 adenylate cyclase/pimeloyl-ACP methyl ester carboxylesterase